MAIPLNRILLQDDSLHSEDLRWDSLQRIFVRIIFRESSWGSSSEDPCADLFRGSSLGSSSEDLCPDPLQRIRVRILFRGGSSSLMSWKGCWCCIICPPTHPAYTVIGLLIIKSSIITIFQSTSSTYQDFLHRAVTKHRFSLCWTLGGRYIF